MPRFHLVKRSTISDRPAGHRRIALAALAFAMSSVVLAGASVTHAAAAPGAGSHATAAVHAAPWRRTEILWGRTVAQWSDTIVAPVAMTVDAVGATQFRTVGAGKALVAFHSPALEAMFAALKDVMARLDLARRHRRHVESQRARAVTTEEVKFRADSNVLAQRAALNRSWGALHDVLAALGHDASMDDVVTALSKSSPQQVAGRYDTIVRPYAVQTGDSRIAAGMHVAKGAPLFRLESSGALFVDVQVAPSRVSSPGGREAQVEAAPGTWRPLTFAGTAPAVDPGTGLAELRFVLDGPAAPLRSGEWVRVRLRDPAQPALWVPAAAVVARGGRSYCIVAAQGRYRAVEVSIGKSEKGMVPVLSGLSPGDRVVTAGAYELLYRDLNSLMQPSD